MRVIEWPVFAPVALAGLAGKLPDTITTRAVIIEMRKRAPHEHVAPYRERIAAAEIDNAANDLAQWATSNAGTLAEATPTMPQGVEDRAAEVWEPLIAIADLAGEQWPELARQACAEHVHSPTRRTPSLGVELLADIREVMGHGDSTDYPTRDRIPTKELLRLLKEREESPWADMGYGQSLTPRRLAQLLAGYNVKSTTYREATGSKKGYVCAANAEQGGLADAWARYLPAPHPPALPEKSVTTVTTVTPQVTRGENVTESVSESVTRQNPNGNSTQARTPRKLAPVTDYSGRVTVTETEKVTNLPPLTSTVTEVTDVTDSESRAVGVDETTLHYVRSALSPTVPLHLTQIEAQLPSHLKSGAPEALRALKANGTVTTTAAGTYLLAEER